MSGIRYPRTAEKPMLYKGKRRNQCPKREHLKDATYREKPSSETSSMNLSHSRRTSNQDFIEKIDIEKVLGGIYRSSKTSTGFTEKLRLKSSSNSNSREVKVSLRSLIEENLFYRPPLSCRNLKERLRNKLSANSPHSKTSLLKLSEENI